MKQSSNSRQIVVNAGNGKTYIYLKKKYKSVELASQRNKKKFFGVHNEVTHFKTRRCLKCNDEFESPNGAYRLCDSHRVQEPGQLYGGVLFG